MYSQFMMHGQKHIKLIYIMWTCRHSNPGPSIPQWTAMPTVLSQLLRRETINLSLTRSSVCVQ